MPCLCFFPFDVSDGSCGIIVGSWSLPFLLLYRNCEIVLLTENIGQM